MVELPGGIDQLETLMEEYENSKEVVDNSKFVFTKHSGSVFCCSLNSSEGLVATGGEDDKVILASNWQMLLILASHWPILSILVALNDRLSRDTCGGSRTGRSCSPWTSGGTA